MPFAFCDEKRTVVRLKQGDVQACYHLSKGASTWILRRHGTGTAYRPGLLDLDPDTSVMEELTLDQVQQQTGQPAKTDSVVTASETWDQILTALDTAGSNAASAGVPPAAPLAQPRDMTGRIIPATDMRHLYSVLKDFNSIEVHAALAREAERGAVSQRLAQRFRTSVEQFGVYCNVEEPFYPADHPKVPDPGSIQKISSDTQLTGLLCHQCEEIGDVEDAPELSFTYVDRQIILSRTTGGAVFSDGRPAIAGKRLDWLLANHADRCPIIAEVKIGNDMNPFYALVQLLMYAAELVTLNQAKRLMRCYGQLQISGIAGPNEDSLPSVDLYLILHRYDRHDQVRNELFEVTERICQRLMEEQAVTSHIRRIACLDAKLSEEGRLSFHKLFCSPRRNS